MNKYWSNKVPFRGVLLAAGLAAGLGMGLPAIASPSATQPQGTGVSAKATSKHKVSDNAITADVQKLLAERLPPRYRVDVKTVGGMVLLKGDLKDRDMVDRVRVMVATVDGVKGVNMLGVDYPFIVTTF